VITRIVFDQEFGQAIRVRGLTLTELAKRAAVTIATASAAARGRPLNVTTATRLARALTAAPVIPELEAWAHAPVGRVPALTASDDAARPGRVALVGASRRRLTTGAAVRNVRDQDQLRMDIA